MAEDKAPLSKDRPPQETQPNAPEGFTTGGIITVVLLGLIPAGLAFAYVLHIIVHALTVNSKPLPYLSGLGIAAFYTALVGSVICFPFWKGKYDAWSGTRQSRLARNYLLTCCAVILASLVISLFVKGTVL